MTKRERNHQQITAAIANRIETINCAIKNLHGAIDETAPTWADVSRLQFFVDALKRADLI